MGVETGIEWCDHTWSPWYGCTKVSPGCKLCYAEARSRRWKNPAATGTWGPVGVRAINKDWRKPLLWDREAAKAGVRRRVFPSLCDWLEDRQELIAIRARFLDLIALTPNLDWLLLTKRPERWRYAMVEIINHRKISPTDDSPAMNWLAGPVLPNVWYGVSVEDQVRADERIPVLLETPAALRWVSYEPALGPVDFAPWMDPAFVSGPDPEDRGITVPGLDWIVVGGESNQGGQEARPFDVAWAAETIAVGKAAGVPVFVKQLGASLSQPLYSCLECRWVDTLDGFDVGGADPGNLFCVKCHAEMVPDEMYRLAHPKGADPSEWPADLRVQQLPTAAGRAA